MTFDIDTEDGGASWSVIDQETGEIAVVNNVVLHGLELGEADDLADLLNAIESTRPPLDH
jgi:hypothetical protein